MESTAKTQGDELASPLLALVLGHPLRARIADKSAVQPLEPAELANALGEPLPLVSYHWRVLRQTGVGGRE